MRNRILARTIEATQLHPGILENLRIETGQSIASKHLVTLRGFYAWQVPSFKVRISLEAVDRLNQCLSDSRLNQSEEQGGILYGTVRDGIPEITNFEFFRSEHRRGVAYDLGARERARVARLVAAQMRGRGAKPLGYFRTHLRPGLFLDQDDFSLMRESFLNPTSIALLIRPDGHSNRTAGFFFWENRDIDRRQTQLMFPFDAAALAPTAILPPEPPRARWQMPVSWVKWTAAALAVPAVVTVVALASQLWR